MYNIFSIIYTYFESHEKIRRSDASAETNNVDNLNVHHEKVVCSARKRERKVKMCRVYSLTSIELLISLVKCTETKKPAETKRSFWLGETSDDWDTNIIYEPFCFEAQVEECFCEEKRNENQECDVIIFWFFSTEFADWELSNDLNKVSEMGSERM